MVSKKMDLAKNSEAPYIFRSYDNRAKQNQTLIPLNPGSASTDFIWEAGRATSAAPTYFKPMQIGNDFFSDGGFSFNNPTQAVYEDVLHKEGFYSTKTKVVPIRLILSIGTGGDDSNAVPKTNESSKPQRKEKPFLHKHISKLTTKMQKEITNTDRVDQSMCATSYKEDWRYIRWTGGSELAELELDKWKPQRGNKASTQTKIENWISTYMSDQQRVAEIEEVAEYLVSVRRRRINYENGDRWHRYTYCSRLICNYCGAKNYKETGTQALLQQHIAKKHNGQQMPYRFPPKVDGGPF